MISTYEEAWAAIQRDRESLIKELEAAAEVAKPKMKRRSRLRPFKVITDDGRELTVEAKHINAAYTRARRKLGTDCVITVDGKDRVLTGVVALE